MRGRCSPQYDESSDGRRFLMIRESECTTIYSEDLNAGQVIDGVRIVNPFV